jgi:hypothetical protein
MREKPESVEQWRIMNRDRLLECRWLGHILPESCKSYQTRAERRIIHFSGDPNPLVRINADYLKCYDPFPCPNLLTDEQLDQHKRSCGRKDQTYIEQKEGVGKARELDNLTNPDHMIMENNRHRSLVKR